MKTPFRRATLVAATQMLAIHTQASFNQMVVRLELEEEIPESTSMSVAKKAGRLARIVASDARRELEAVGGKTTLGQAVVDEAVAAMEPCSSWSRQAIFEQALANNGYAVRWEEQHEPGVGYRMHLVPALPPELDQGDGEDEIHVLLKANGFRLSLSHLDQALKAHGRGDWAAANGQLRTFWEALVSDVATRVGIDNAVSLTTENRLRKLAQAGFLSEKRKEWTGDGKSFVNGFMKMLHTEGAHPGLSDSEHCTFRVHLVLLTARHWLRRLGD